MRFLVFLFAAGLAFSQQSGIWNYEPITGEGRAKWAVLETISPGNLAADAVVAGLATWDHAPKEYDTHWGGFGKRIGLSMSIVAMNHTLESGLGAIWGEDPRYFPDEGQPFKHRLGHVIKMTFMATNRDGRTIPAFARYAAFTGSNFLANEWVPDSQATSGNAGFRIGLCFVGRMASNGFDEFWPDVKRIVFRRDR
jgi:hypothetical protein